MQIPRAFSALKTYRPVLEVTLLLALLLRLVHLPLLLGD
jgi:hypothetical protein